MNAHLVSISEPIRRTTFEVTFVIFALRCLTCPTWHPEVRDRGEATKARAEHEATGR